MTPFLLQVARHYAAGDLGRTCFVFPNRRSMLFFKSYLTAEIAASGCPAIAPGLLPVNDFFESFAGGRTVPGRIEQLLILYKCYSELNPSAEPLDDFIFWGDMLLGDFNDVNKYLVDPKIIFTNVAEFKEIRDYDSYLNETQKAALAKFLKHFESSVESKPLKEKFRRIWNLLLPLYDKFNAELESREMIISGQMYRSLAARFSEESAVDILAGCLPQYDRFVFVGLNALCEAEKVVLRRMMKAGIAEFCWDYASDWIKDRNNRSSHFMESNVQEFTPAFKLEKTSVPEINVLSVPSTVGQTKQLPSIFRRLGGQIGINTAVVLPDEKLLIPVLNAIPAEIRQINVTMGYPMGASTIWSLMDDLSSMLLHQRETGGEYYFYHRQVISVFSNTFFKAALSEADAETVAALKKKISFYVPAREFAGSELLSKVFRPLAVDFTVASPDTIESICNYLQDALSAIASRVAVTDEKMGLELSFAKAYYLALGKMKEYRLALLPRNFFKLLFTMVSRETVPFKGEPLGGLQIMGPLETRALDFENLVILSCNEDVFPRRNVGESFIPAELRKGFGLPTYEFQDAVWAYYFYRLIQRANKVWLVFDSIADLGKSGEESRYIKQIELHFGAKINRFVAKSPIGKSALPDHIEKTQEHIDALKKWHVSASSLQEYLKCQAMFFYSSVERLSEEDEVGEVLDGGMIGSVFHKTMEILYKGRKTVDVAYLQSLLDSTVPAELVRKGIESVLKFNGKFELTGRNLILEQMIVSFVRQALVRDRELIGTKGHPITIKGIEKIIGGQLGPFPFTGTIDRVDSVEPGVTRIVDYKTGRVLESDFDITSENAGSVVADLLGDDNSKRPKIALQLYLYDRFGRQLAAGDKMVNSIYQTSLLFTEPVREVDLCPEFTRAMDAAVDRIVSDIADLKQPWKRTEDEKACESCKFKSLCGR